jgi:hypothetical protein
VTAAAGAAPAPGGPEAPEAGWSDLVPRIPEARHLFVAPGGKPGNAGTRESPWDLVSALSGRQKVAPGDVVWVRGGAYRSDAEKFELGLAGKEGAPVIVRGYPGERATILDNGLTTLEGAAHVWLWDLEITISVPPKDRTPAPVPPRPTDAPASVGLRARWGQGCKFINLAVHDNPGGGMDWWAEAGGGEVHGCLFYGNGWRAPDAKHGHALYTQNRDGLKTVSGCVMSVPTDDPYTVYAFGSERAYVDNFLVEDNILYGKGPFLVGGGRPSRGVRVLRNYLHGVDMRVGSTAGNEEGEVRDNVIARGALTVQKFKTLVNRGNTQELPQRRAVLIPNKYDPGRAHLAVYNGAGASKVPVDVAGFLRPGEAYRLLDPKDPFGAPVAAGTCQGTTVDVSLAGEFAAFVVLKGREMP